MITLVQEVLFLLADDEDGHAGTTYDPDLVAHFVEEAVVAVLGLDPSLYPLQITVPLKPGAVQDIPADCAGFGAVVHSLDAFGQPQATIPTRTKPTAASRFAGAAQLFTCPAGPSTGDFTVSSYSYQPLNPRQFYITPPAPVGVNASVVIACPASAARVRADLAAGLNIETTPLGRFHAAIVSWAAYRCCMRDSDSVDSQVRADRHLAAFTALTAGFTRAKRRLEADEPMADALAAANA